MGEQYEVLGLLEVTFRFYPFMINMITVKYYDTQV